MAMGNRVLAYNRLGYDVPMARQMFHKLEELEQWSAKVLEKLLKFEPIYTAYLDKVKGVGPLLSAAMMAEIADPGRFDTISALWAYSGLHVNDDGEAAKRRKGSQANWNQNLRMILAGRLADSFIKQRPDTTGRRLYDQYKCFYTERDGETLSKGHINNRARRKLVKVFLACLWVAWRRIKGLPVSEPYAMKLRGHSHLVTPDDWAGQDWDKAWQDKLFEVEQRE